jgi:hypothetical protein
MPDETFTGPENIPKTHTHADFLNHLRKSVRMAGKRQLPVKGNHLVGILGVDIVLDGIDAVLAKVLRGDLNQISYLGLLCPLH